MLRIDMDVCFTVQYSWLLPLPGPLLSAVGSGGYSPNRSAAGDHHLPAGDTGGFPAQ